MSLHTDSQGSTAPPFVLRIEIRSTLLQRCQEGIKEALLRLGVTPQQLLGISLKQRLGGVAMWRWRW